jgi:hypothetical protein
MQKPGGAHSAPAPQLSPHAPQFCGSCPGSTHVPPQHVPGYAVATEPLLIPNAHGVASAAPVQSNGRHDRLSVGNVSVHTVAGEQVMPAVSHRLTTTAASPAASPAASEVPASRAAE